LQTKHETQKQLPASRFHHQSPHDHTPNRHFLSKETHTQTQPQLFPNVLFDNQQRFFVASWCIVVGQQATIHQATTRINKTTQKLITC
jgi:hypothetical protein